jgi:hypothetical protein
MKRILFVLIATCSLNSYASCDESWKKSDYEQNINSYKVLNKIFFHSTPDDNSKNSKLFLINNDYFVGFLKSVGFEFGRYTRKDGSIVMGWLKDDALSETKKVNKPEINDSDFSIYSPNGSIDLSSSFEDFYKIWGKCGKNEQLETGAWSNYISKGDETYKYFDHYWKGFTIRSSNINYKQHNNDFDLYRITTITITNKKYITSRGIYIGMTKNEIINAYGEPASINKGSISYNFKNKTLSFMLENNIIKSIILDENAM